MKTKILFCIVLGILILCPSLFFAQDPSSTEDYNKLLQYLKGDGAFEKWFFEAFKNIDTQITSNAIAASFVGRAIGGMGALMYLGYLGWQMQEGARPWEVTPMLRPIFMGLILMNWTSFTSMIQQPLESLAKPGQNIFQALEKDANKLRVERYKMQHQLVTALIEKKAEEEAKEEVGKSLGEKIGHYVNKGMEQILSPIKEFHLRFNFEFQRLIMDLLEAIGLTILRVCTYLIFTIQKIWAYVLIVLGPFAVGISLIPGFENSFNNWVAKFININLYTFISFIIINIGQQIIMAGYEMEIDRYKELITDTGLDWNMVYATISSNGLIYAGLFTLVAYAISGIGMLMVPTIADSIIAAGGAGIMSKAKSAAQSGYNVSNMGGSIAKAIATKGSSIAGDAIKAGISGTNRGTASGLVSGAMKGGK